MERTSDYKGWLGQGQTRLDESAQNADAYKTVAPIPANDKPAITELGGAQKRESSGILGANADTQPPFQNAQPEVIGFIDGVSAQGHLKGWACVKGRHDQRVEVEIYDGVDLVVRGIADQFRQSLSDTKVSDGASGFEVPLPPGLLNGKPRSLVVRCEATQARPLVLQYEVGNTAEPKEIANATTNRHLVRVKPLTETVVAGPPALASLYVVGQHILTRAPYPAPPYHVSGWWKPEPDFTWIRGFEATIEMYVRSPRRSYTFIIEVVPNGVGRQIQTLQIFFNRQRVAFAEVPHPMTVSVEVPREVFTSRISVINLHCRNAIVSSEFGAPDDRRLGIAVRSWQLA